MGTDHLNIFLPYVDKPLAHEDQLTRALLILVRSIRVVESMFFELLVQRMAELGIEERPPLMTAAPGGVETIETQVWSTTRRRLDDEPGRLVSVIITDSKLHPEHRVARTDRAAVYDGFLKYRPHWAFVVESKPDNDIVWWTQLSAARNASQEVERTPVVLSWSEILTRLNAVRDNGLLHDAAAAMVSDFFAFACSCFPELDPCKSFQGCDGDKRRLDRRCSQILNDADLGPVEYHRGSHDSIRITRKPGVKEVVLHCSDDVAAPWGIVLDLNLGDTMAQAQALYSTIDAGKVAQLCDRGWHVKPNFHFAYRSSGLHWGRGTISTGEYIDFWAKQIAAGDLRPIQRDEWHSRWREGCAIGFLSDLDFGELDARLMATAIPRLDVCPGLNLRFVWPADVAVAVDQAGTDRFLRAFHDKVEEALSVW